jgi:uridine kinase
MSQPFMLAICGGTASGKTTLARILQQSLGKAHCELLFQDYYYIDQSHRFDHDGGSVNFDHPDAIEFALMEEHLSLLKKGKPVEAPVYDFSSHTRTNEVILVEPKRVVIVDGILILSRERLHTHFDHVVFLDIDEEIRFQRRLKRDVQERGREPEGVRTQFTRQVQPMHQKFVEPFKSRAHEVFDDPEGLKSFAEELYRRLKKGLT